MELFVPALSLDWQKFRLSLILFTFFGVDGSLPALSAGLWGVYFRVGRDSLFFRRTLHWPIPSMRLLGGFGPHNCFRPGILFWPGIFG